MRDRNGRPLWHTSGWWAQAQSCPGGQSVGTVLPDDPSFTIGGVSVTEGQSGTTPAPFVVTLSPSSQPVSVGWRTLGGTATSGNDFTAVNSGSLSFPPSPAFQTQTVSVLVNGDTVYELDETFTVRLSTSVNANAYLDDANGVGTIVNDDAAPILSVGDVTVTEGQSGTTTASFTVTLSPASPRAVSVSFTTPLALLVSIPPPMPPGVASPYEDYVNSSGTLTLPAGTTTATIPVSTRGDVLEEPNETFPLTLSNPSGALLGDAEGVGTIVDDDTPGSSPSATIDDVTVTEGAGGTSALARFTVRLSVASSQPVTVSYAARDVTASTGVDYSAASGQVTFSPGQTSKTLDITVLGDALGEIDEQFWVELTGATHATLATSHGVGTIRDDDRIAIDPALPGAFVRGHHRPPPRPSLDRQPASGHRHGEAHRDQSHRRGAHLEPPPLTPASGNFDRADTRLAVRRESRRAARRSGRSRLLTQDFARFSSESRASRSSSVRSRGSSRKGSTSRIMAGQSSEATRSTRTLLHVCGPTSGPPQRLWTRALCSNSKFGTGRSGLVRYQERSKRSRPLPEGRHSTAWTFPAMQDARSCTRRPIGTCRVTSRVSMTAPAGGCVSSSRRIMSFARLSNDRLASRSRPGNFTAAVWTALPVLRVISTA
jgi:hypothetical protein